MAFKIMTGNLANFFPVGAVSGAKPQAEYELKVETLWWVIADQDPDVVTLQDVGEVGAAAVPSPLVDLADAPWRRSVHDPRVHEAGRPWHPRSCAG